MKYIFLSFLIVATGCEFEVKTERKKSLTIREGCEAETRYDSSCQAVFLKDIRDALRENK